MLVPCFCFSALGKSVCDIDIPYTKHVLDNGLTLIIHEDHKAPIVAVNVWYHVGSKNEKAGKTGFAHLFEHLMFNGSENFNDDYFKAMEKVGATDLNGTTSSDRTNYFQNVPKDALDLALWMESDRMGHLLGAIDQDKLEEQRGVVKNEKRQGQNRPYAIAYELITENTWPKGHPYSWTVIGSMEDLDAASLDDVGEWFKSYYGAANATLVVAGDVNPAETLAKVKKYFGDIPSGPPVARFGAFVAKRSGTQRMTAQDRVPQARIHKVWNIPPYGTTEGIYLNLAANVLGSGKSSRLYKRLVHDEQIATDVSVYAWLREIAGQFTIVATAKPGVDLKQVEQAIDEEMALFLKKGPTSAELERVKALNMASFVRGIERIGGFGGKADALAHNFVFTGDPAYYKTHLKEMREAATRDVMECAEEWLSDGQFILGIHPFPEYSTTTSRVDRSKLPAPELKSDARFPEFVRKKLANGLKIVLAERHAIPLVQFSLMVDSGFAADQLAAPGTASMTMGMLDEGTRKRTALEISTELDEIGAKLSASCNLDTAMVSLNTLTDHMDDALDIYADVILNPAFRQEDFERLQKQRLAAIKHEKVNPESLAMRVLPQLLYGRDHAYGNPFSGSGTEASVSAMKPADTRKFYETWFKADNATLIVVGAIEMDELMPKLERLFKDWEPGGVPEKNMTAVEPPAGPSIYIIDRPGAEQSVICASVLTLPKANPDEMAIEVMNGILGGTFTSRVNMNLREDKHWSYGVRSKLIDAAGPRPFLCSGSVQGDKTSEAMRELDKEFRWHAGSKPPNEGELKKVVTQKSLQLAGTWETIGAVTGSLTEMERFGLPEDYFESYARNLKALTLRDIDRMAKTVVQPDRMTWVIVGDRAKIEQGIRELKWGEVKILDADGNLLE